jgi:adenylate kinase
VVLGKQGAGKGTQCARLSRHYVIPHISTGDVFRSAVGAGTPFGKIAEQYIDEGSLVPDEVVLGVVTERLDHESTRQRGFILDGFPRTQVQALGLTDLLAPDDLDLVVDLEIPIEVALGRLSQRRVCVSCGTNYSLSSPPSFNWTCDICGGEVVRREDDSEEAINRRLELYEEETAPLIEWYGVRDKLAVVDGLGDPEVVQRNIVAVVDAARALRDH